MSLWPAWPTLSLGITDAQSVSVTPQCGQPPPRLGMPSYPLAIYISLIPKLSQCPDMTKPTGHCDTLSQLHHVSRSVLHGAPHPSVCRLLTPSILSSGQVGSEARGPGAGRADRKGRCSPRPRDSPAFWALPVTFLTSFVQAPYPVPPRFPVLESLLTQ